MGLDKQSGRRLFTRENISPTVSSAYSYNRACSMYVLAVKLRVHCRTEWQSCVKPQKEHDPQYNNVTTYRVRNKRHDQENSTRASSETA